MDDQGETMILNDSRARLEVAGMMVATFPDGKGRVGTKAYLSKYPDALLWSPEGMVHYINMPVAQRRTLLAFRLQYGGTLEWKSR